MNKLNIKQKWNFISSLGIDNNFEVIAINESWGIVACHFLRDKPILHNDKFVYSVSVSIISNTITTNTELN